MEDPYGLSIGPIIDQDELGQEGECGGVGRDRLS